MTRQGETGRDIADKTVLITGANRGIGRALARLSCAESGFLLAEPACPETPFVAGFEEWNARQPPRYTREIWERFWSRANALLGYDHTTLLGPREPIASETACRSGDGCPCSNMPASSLLMCC
jgi:hypothetical protein